MAELIESDIEQQLADTALPSPSDAKNKELPGVATIIDNSWQLILSIAAVSTLTAVLITYILGSTYVSTLKILILPKLEPTITGNLVNPKQPFAQNLSHVVTSDIILKRTIDALKLDRAEPSPTGFVGVAKTSLRQLIGYTIVLLKYGEIKHVPRRQLIYDDMAKSIEAKVLEDSGIIEITVKWSDPRVAATMANYIGKSFVEYNKEANRVDAMKADELIGDRLASAESAAKKAGAELIRFKSERKIKETDVDAASKLSQTDQLAFNALQDELAAAENNFLYWQNYGQENRARTITGEEQLRILGSANTPVYPAKPVKILYAAIGLTVGILIGFLAAIAIEIKEDLIARDNLS